MPLFRAPPDPETFAAAIARKQGWTAPGNLLAILAVLIALASLVVALLH